MSWKLLHILLLWLAVSTATPPNKCDSKPPPEPLPNGEYDFIIVGGGRCKYIITYFVGINLRYQVLLERLLLLD